MRKLAQTSLVVMFVAMVCAAFVGSVSIVSWETAQAAEPESARPAEPAPPAGQTYVGPKKCAACHFKQLMSWKSTKHTKAFDLLPAKYQKDEECLPCHTTGFGHESGYKDLKTTPALAGITCESCHGPGSKHAEICKAFVGGKPDAAQEKTARDAIWRVRPGLVCISCHRIQAHGKRGTPKALRTKK